MNLQALKAAAYDTLVEIEHLQARLRQLNEAIMEESRRQRAENAVESNGARCELAGSS